MRINSWPDFIFSKQIQHFKLSAKIDEQLKVEGKNSFNSDISFNLEIESAICFLFKVAFTSITE